MLPSYIVATVDEHSKSLQVLSNGCVRTESRQEEAQERIMKLERQVKHQADEIIKLQTKHAEHQSQIEELKRVLHRSMGSSTEAAADSGACGEQQQQPQQFLLTPEAERQTPSFGQQTAEAEVVEDEWWGLVDRHGWPQGGFTNDPPELPASLSRSRQAPLPQQQDVMRPFYSHALGTDLTRNASSMGSQTAVPINNSGSMPMRSTTAAEHIQCDPEDSKGIPDNRWKMLKDLPELKISGAQAWETGIQLSSWKSQCITICSGIGAKFVTYFTDTWKQAEKLYRIQSETLAIPQAPAVRSEDLDLEARLTSAMLRVLPDSVKVPVVERAGDGLISSVMLFVSVLSRLQPAGPEETQTLLNFLRNPPVASTVTDVESTLRRYRLAQRRLTQLGLPDIAPGEQLRGISNMIKTIEKKYPAFSMRINLLKLFPETSSRPTSDGIEKYLTTIEAQITELSADESCRSFKQDFGNASVISTAAAEKDSRRCYFHSKPGGCKRDNCQFKHEGPSGGSAGKGKGKGDKDEKGGGKGAKGGKDGKGGKEARGRIPMLTRLMRPPVLIPRLTRKPAPKLIRKPTLKQALSNCSELIRTRARLRLVRRLHPSESSECK